MTKNWALFLDFDGTLVDIAASPDAVAVPARLPHLLDELRYQLDGALALVSGRSIATLDALLRPVKFDMAGLHGLEHRTGDQLEVCDPDSHAAFRRAVALIGEQLRSLDGIIVEDKGCAVAVHWRLAPDKLDVAVQCVRRQHAELGPDYRLQLGKAVVELLPAQCDKGQAIASFMQKPPFLGRCPIFVGDDVTDEAGFAAVNASSGISVRVGRGATGARHILGSPAQVREQLARWVAAGGINPEFEIAA